MKVINCQFLANKSGTHTDIFKVVDNSVAWKLECVKSLTY
jgi:hypothetical protein